MKPQAFDMHADWSFETVGYQGEVIHVCWFVYTCNLVWLHYFKHYNIYFQCLVDAHSSNPEARELI